MELDNINQIKPPARSVEEKFTLDVKISAWKRVAFLVVALIATLPLGIGLFFQPVRNCYIKFWTGKECIIESSLVTHKNNKPTEKLENQNPVETEELISLREQKMNCLSSGEQIKPEPLKNDSTEQVSEDKPLKIAKQKVIDYLFRKHPRATALAIAALGFFTVGAFYYLSSSLPTSSDPIKQSITCWSQNKVKIDSDFINKCIKLYGDSNKLVFSNIANVMSTARESGEVEITFDALVKQSA